MPPTDQPREHARARRPRTAGLVLGLLAIACLGLIAVGLVSPWQYAVGRYGIAGQAERLVLGGSTDPMAVTRVSSSELPVWQVSNQARIVVGPSVRWRPCTANAILSIGAATPASPGGGVAGAMTVCSLSTLWIPLWWPGLLFLGISAACFWRATKYRRAGACVACGYDLRGLVGPTCPECGGASI